MSTYMYIVNKIYSLTLFNKKPCTISKIYIIHKYKYIKSGTLIITTPNWMCGVAPFAPSSAGIDCDYKDSIQWQHWQEAYEVVSVDYCGVLLFAIWFSVSQSILYYDNNDTHLQILFIYQKMPVSGKK